MSSNGIIFKFRKKQAYSRVDIGRHRAKHQVQGLKREYVKC
jgi:hypothetical protein